VYLIHLKPVRNFKRRQISVNNYGELVQADLAQMYTYDNYKYFLLLVDAFSSKVLVRPLKSKTSIEVKNAFEDIFDEFQATIYVLETDRGKGKFFKILFSTL
jgi:tRNA(Met) C34 N-acetyltransferase TmcA